MGFNFGGAIQGGAAGASAGSAFGPWGAAIGGGIGALGGGFSGDGGSDASEAAHAMFDRNAALQYDFAQNGVRWRVEDAKAAGIHPLFALGAQLQSAAPIQTFIEGVGKTGVDWHAAGQDIGRAIDSTRTDQERFTARMQALQLQRGELENQLLLSQIARLNQQNTPPTPAVQAYGSGAGLIEEKPLERNTSVVGAPHIEAGAINELGFARTGRGGFRPVQSKDFHDRAEENIISNAVWSMNNQLLPNIPGRGYPPPETWLPEGASRWRWSHLSQEWLPYFPPDLSRPENRTRFNYREVYRGRIGE